MRGKIDSSGAYAIDVDASLLGDDFGDSLVAYIKEREPHLTEDEIIARLRTYLENSE